MNQAENSEENPVSGRSSNFFSFNIDKASQAELSQEQSLRDSEPPTKSGARPDPNANLVNISQQNESAVSNIQR
jgi:hypothetical protein